MHLSSETVGSLAAALARAQQELKNPEKSLTAVMPSASAREKDRSFRYASLASGLDIIRKSLGRQEIAAIQTTAIDKDAGLVRLTTVLAHSSGEWVSSEWPVCPVADAADPQRMGAALTYARRYALFTLVGIAGEDDLDAPDASRTLNGGHAPSIGAATLSSANGAGSPRRANGSRSPVSPPVLALADSEVLRDALLAELSGLASIEGLTEWAHRRLPAKNSLQRDDAHAVEAAFQTRLDACSYGTPDDGTSTRAESIKGPNRNSVDNASSEGRSTIKANQHHDDQEACSSDGTEHDPPAGSVGATTTSSRRAHRSRRSPTSSQDDDGVVRPAAQPSAELRLALEKSLVEPSSSLAPTSNLASQPRSAIDKSALLFQEPKRVRDKEHLRYVASQPCLLCSAKPCDAHHIRFAQPKALGRKVSDEFAVPLCRRHHRDLHQSGNEAAWWHDLAIDPIEIARQLWDETVSTKSRSS